MGNLHIAGFEIHLPKDPGEDSPAILGGGGRAIDGTPAGGFAAEVEQLNYSTKLISLDEARAIANLCRRANGAHWTCDNTVYAAQNGLALDETPTFDAGTVKFGTHSATISSGGGSGDIDVVSSMATLHTVAGWVKDGSGGTWTHYIERSDGAKWVDASRNDGATIPWSIATSTWTLSQDGTNDRWFDDLVYLPFEIFADWGADWPQTETFSDLPRLDVWGDLVGDYQFEAYISTKIADQKSAFIDGSQQLAATVSLDIRGGARTERN